ncbi:hypothetical protein [Rhodococcoides yunnanense]|jgi:DNA-binding MarR family transcriptional regulator|uniref:hypothetical protein n=1 Tax=Rhodococcoides yunnanense TaxID=278209 RepID=UPI0022B20763|nr:hypothetical protein [Rhodococcus yunnanensis]MCZ4276520.1 hypothetical protein [Rhodococcus yunnanensis]
MSSDQPLGYLVKQLDNELNDYVDTALRTEHGVGRAHWQALRTAFGDRKLLLSTFTSEARTFYSDAELAELLSSLTENGWIDVEGATDSERIMVLTDQGEELLNRMMQTQNRTMQIATEGVSEADYETTRTTLDRMASNLHTASAALCRPMSVEIH